MSRVRRLAACVWRPSLCLALACLAVGAGTTAAGSEGAAELAAIGAWATLLTGGITGLLGTDR